MRKGQMLLEVVLALAVMMLVMVGLVGLSTRSIKNSDFSRSQVEATSYANEAMEWIRSERVRLGWPLFFPKSGSTYCLSSLGAWPVVGVCTNNFITGSRPGMDYTRQATLTTIQATTPQRVQVTATVKWDQGGKTYSAKQDAIFTQF